MTFSIFFFLLYSATFAQKKLEQSPVLSKKEIKYIYLISEAHKNRLLGYDQKAIKQYLEASTVNPKSSIANFYLAAIFMAQKDYNSAVSFAEKAVNLDENNVWYALELADALRFSDKQKSLKIYEKIWKENKDNKLIYKRLEDIYKENGNLEKLEELYAFGLKRCSSCKTEQEKYLHLYNLYVKAKKYQKAEEILRNLQKNSPGNKNFEFLLAEFYVFRGNNEKAQKMYAQLLEKYPDDNDCKFSYFYFLKAQKKHEKLFPLAKSLITSNIDFKKKVEIAEISPAVFSPQEHFQLIDILYKDNPNQLITNTLMAEHILRGEDKKSALPYIKKAVELSNYDFQLVLTLCKISEMTGSFSEMYTDSDRFLLYYPNKPELYFYKGRAAYELKKYDEAQRILKTGKNLIIENPKLSADFDHYLKKIESNQ